MSPVEVCFDEDTAWFMLDEDGVFLILEEGLAMLPADSFARRLIAPMLPVLRTFVEVEGRGAELSEREAKQLMFVMGHIVYREKKLYQWPDGDRYAMMAVRSIVNADIDGACVYAAAVRPRGMQAALDRLAAVLDAHGLGDKARLDRAVKDVPRREMRGARVLH